MSRFVFLFFLMVGCSQPSSLRWTPPGDPSLGPQTTPLGSPKPTAEPTPTPTPHPENEWFARLQTSIFNPKCVQCHQPGHERGNIDLTSYESIMKVRGLVIPKDPDNSILFIAVAAEEMPPRTPLGDEDKIAIYKWILAGAPKVTRGSEDQDR
jgi:hypothetical protein